METGEEPLLDNNEHFFLACDTYIDDTGHPFIWLFPKRDTRTCSRAFGSEIVTAQSN